MSQRHSDHREQQFVSSAFSVYATEVRKAITNQKQQLDQLEAAHEQLQQTIDSLEQLPSQLRHQVMVPMGKNAFFPGHLTRTNEIMVHLGDQYYVEVTAGHARGTLQRKQAAVADGINKAQQQLKALQARLDVSSDSIGSATNESEAREIRTSLAESDALLATASKASKAAAAAAVAAAAAAAGEAAQQQPQRVKSASGYTYTRPQGPSTAQQRSAQQDAEDSELQAKLEQLLLLEQQQELQDILQDTSTQQQQQHAGLGTIQEDEEGSDGEGSDEEGSHETEIAVLPRVSSQQQRVGVGSTAQLSAVDHLQQLEAQSDSDDDELQLQLQRVQQVLQQQPVHAVQGAQPQQPVQVQPVQAQHAQQQQQQRQPLKSALKKGFLGPATSSSSSSSRSHSAASRSSAPPAAKPKPAAFTGTVVERTAPDAEAAVAAPVAGAIVERPAQAPGSSGAAGGSSSSSSNKPMSKFKARRLGLDPQDD